jgi:hypothetical protein
LGGVLSFHIGHFGGQETPIVSVPKMLSATFAHPNLFYKLAKKLKEVDTLEKLHMMMADMKYLGLFSPAWVSAATKGLLEGLFDSLLEEITETVEFIG